MVRAHRLGGQGVQPVVAALGVMWCGVVCLWCRVVLCCISFSIVLLWFFLYLLAVIFACVAFLLVCHRLSDRAFVCSVCVHVSSNACTSICNNVACLFTALMERFCDPYTFCDESALHGPMPLSQYEDLHTPEEWDRLLQAMRANRVICSRSIGCLHVRSCRYHL